MIRETRAVRDAARLASQEKARPAPAKPRGPRRQRSRTLDEERRREGDRYYLREEERR